MNENLHKIPPHKLEELDNLALTRLATWADLFAEDKNPEVQDAANKLKQDILDVVTARLNA